MTDDLSKTLELPAIVPTAERRSLFPEPEPTLRLSESALEFFNDTATTEKVLSVPSSGPNDRATLTVLTAINAGQVFAVDKDEIVLGRDKGADIALDDGSISRRHAVVRRLEGGKYVIADAGSTNGTFVGARKVEGPTTLSSGDRIQLGPNVLVRFTLTDETEASLQRRLYESSTRDALTETFNRKYMNERLAAEIAYARRHKSALGVLLVDVDHFKAINDTHGHLVGDRVLKALASLLGRTIRLEDVLARYGGEEFAVIARASSAVDAERLAERLRVAVERLRVPTDQGELAVTVSIGVAYAAEVADDPIGMALLKRADDRLYRAKEAGRNRICARD